MRYLRPLYLFAGGVVALAALAYWLLPHGDLLRDLSAIPLVGSLLAVLVQMLRDESNRQHSAILQESQNRFVLAAGSHMASVAFDKHVQFCEEYVAEVQQTLQTLFRKSATDELFRHTRKLQDIQEKYAVWLTPQIESDLELFESALRKMGATAGLIHSGANVDDRQQRITDLYKTLAGVMGKRFFLNGWNGQPVDESVAVTQVIQRLRRVLGTEELTTMRTSLVSRAIRLADG
ncbi:MAG: hypothetical protein ACT6T0_13605 [Nevskia sp.]|uniref:hypothetical protein n=1 Tax=Nevskia sp. TaxID=1929292 RepID=UPI0040372F72